MHEQSMLPARESGGFVGLALSGKRYTGKSFAAQFLASIFPHLMSFPSSIADVAKMEYAKMSRIPSAYLYEKRTKEEHRPALLQYVDFKRKAGANYFLDRYLAGPARQAMLAGSIVLLDDPRLPEELDKLIEVGYYPLRVESPVELRVKRGLVVSDVDTHETETALDNLPLWSNHKHLVWNFYNPEYPDTGDLFKAALLSKVLSAFSLGGQAA